MPSWFCLEVCFFAWTCRLNPLLVNFVVFLSHFHVVRSKEDFINARKSFLDQQTRLSFVNKELSTAKKKIKDVRESQLDNSQSSQVSDNDNTLVKKAKELISLQKSLVQLLKIQKELGDAVKSFRWGSNHQLSTFWRIFADLTDIELNFKLITRLIEVNNCCRKHSHGPYGFRFAEKDSTNASSLVSYENSRRQHVICYTFLFLHFLFIDHRNYKPGYTI